MMNLAFVLALQDGLLPPAADKNLATFITF